MSCRFPDPKSLLIGTFCPHPQSHPLLCWGSMTFLPIFLLLTLTANMVVAKPEPQPQPGQVMCPSQACNSDSDCTRSAMCTKCKIRTPTTSPKKGWCNMWWNSRWQLQGYWSTNKNIGNVHLHYLIIWNKFAKKNTYIYTCTLKFWSLFYLLKYLVLKS